MWIVMLETVVGPLGLHYKDERKDLPADVVAALRKQSPGCLRKSRPPWEDGVDRRARDLARREASAAAARQKADGLRVEAEELAARADKLVVPAAEHQKIEAQAKDAADKAVEAARAEGADVKVKRIAVTRARLAEFAGLRCQQAQAELMLAIAGAGLKEMEAEDAARHAERLAAKLEEAKAKPPRRRAGPPAEAGAKDADDPDRPPVPAE